MITVSHMMFVLDGKKAVIGRGRKTREIREEDKNLEVKDLMVRNDGAIVLMVGGSANGK